jgi:nitroimidazol reductase NimA-like FMN-containing flavoprotein (pyridoxamine 5'-phosphate oxidase superfamily)
MRRFARLTLQASEAFMGDIPVTSRTKIKRRADRSVSDRATIYAILDEAFCASVAVSIAGQPHVQPMLHARDGDTLILHGHSKNRMIAHLCSGGEVCVNVTIMDGLVMGGTIPDHTMNYRSVTIYGRTAEVTSLEEKRVLMRGVFESLIARRWHALPPVDEAYLNKATRVVRLPLDECVAKINNSEPEEPAQSPEVWTGVLPLEWRWGPPRTVGLGSPVGRKTAPEGIEKYRRPQR